MELTKKHVIVLRPDSALQEILRPHGSMAQAGSNKPTLMLSCAGVSQRIPGFLDLAIESPTQKEAFHLQLPLSEILLISDDRDTGPRPIGFLQGQ